MTSILESEYVKPTRPYSQNELKDNRKKFFDRYNISDVFACHKKCGHFYRVKKNGKKYKYISETENSDTGNCSICWKLSKTPNYLKENAKDLIYLYEDRFKNDPDRLTYDNNDIEECYYRWIYEQS